MLRNVQNANWNDKLPDNIRFFYQDPDGEIISVDSQEDLDEAFLLLNQMKQIVNFCIASDVIEAHKIIFNIEDNQMLANILNDTMPGIIDDSFITQESQIYDYQAI